MHARIWLTAAAIATTAACGRTDPTTFGPMPGEEGACLDGETPLVPRVLAAAGPFSGVALAGGDVLAAGTDLLSVPLSGGPAVTIAHADGVRGVLVAGATAYFQASHPVGVPDP